MENPINYWYQKYISLKAEIDKMMEEAVEWVVSIDISDITGREYFSVHCYEFNTTRKFKDGDKVRIIIVKEDEK